MVNFFNYYVAIGYVNWLHLRIKRFIGHRQKRLDFLGIGVAKAGTTALHDYLIQHPQLGMGDKKEIHFFDRPEHFFIPNWFYFRYHKHFNFNSGKKMYGEITPAYLYYRNAAERIWEYNPKIKLIAILRNPIERAYSHWNMNNQLNRDILSFEESIARERERSKRTLPYQHRYYTAIDRGFYSAQIREYQRFFPDNQMLFIQYDTFKKNPKETLETIFKFLEVDPSLFDFSPLKSNVIEYKSNMNPNTKNKLIDIYRNDIHEVERMLNWDCSNWLK
ncbi:MAG: sulfotransferase domain-containing protein [Chitinophagaceae bacterium]|nr:sulfotransferase domain-containing protein [Chitinophagaceae bacterium]